MSSTIISILQNPSILKSELERFAVHSDLALESAETLRWCVLVGILVPNNRIPHPMSVTPIYYQYTRPEMIDFLPSLYANVLEVGCGEGQFLRQLKPTGEAWAVELDQTVSERSSSTGAKILVGTYADVETEIPAKHFDLVVCNDVIEHMPDSDWFLRSIRTKLRAGGVIVGSIPNVRYLPHLFELIILKDWRYRDSMILDRTHLRFFTQKSLRRSLEENHFIVEELRGINESEKFLNRLLLRAIAVLTFGWFADSRFLQFGFRARRAE